MKYTKGIVNKYCIYKDFLCPEDENAKCHYIDEIYKYSYDDDFYPIINTCLKEQVEEGTCKTKKCESDQDCYSGTCYSNSCITISPIYKCEQFDLSKRRDNQYDLIGRKEDINKRFSCSKIDNMKCNNNSECTKYCKNGYCSWEIQGDSYFQVLRNSLKLLREVVFSTAIVLLLIAVLVIIFYFKEKRDKKKREQANKKQDKKKQANKKQDKKKQAKNKKD